MPLCYNEPVTLLLPRMRLWLSQALWVIPLAGILVAYGVSQALQRYDEQLRGLSPTSCHRPPRRPSWPPSAAGW